MTEARGLRGGWQTVAAIVAVALGIGAVFWQVAAQSARVDENTRVITEMQPTLREIDRRTFRMEGQLEMLRDEEPRQ